MPQAQSSGFLRLFCFPTRWWALGFRSWSNSLPPTGRGLSRRTPGRGSADSLTCCPSFRSLQLFFHIWTNHLPSGHSMGALVSFELARLLRRDYGLLPAHLFVSGRRAPQIPDLDPPIHTLPEPEFWRNYAVSTERLRRYWKTRN